MKNVFFVILISLLLSSCYYGSYTIKLQQVERPENAKERWGNSKIVNFEEEGETKYSYEDDMIYIVWLPLSTQFSFTMKNKTNHSIKIIWDEAVYVDQNGSSGRVMHSGVKYIDRSNPQPPTIVVKNANISDMIVPVDNIYYSDGWNTIPLFPNQANSEEELQSKANKYIGKEVKILLPLKIEDTVNEYIFTFKIEDFTSK